MSSNQSDALAYIKRKKRKRELQYYWVSFALMIIFTLLAFLSVKMHTLGANFTSLFIITLAIVQVIFQLYYFMHLKDRDHEFPTIFIYSGGFVALVTVITFMTIIWPS